jgi:hypothetical protein
VGPTTRSCRPNATPGKSIDRGGAAAGAKTGALQFMVPRSVRPSAWMELHAPRHRRRRPNRGPTSTRSCRLNATPGRSTDRGGASSQNLAFPAAAAAPAPARRRDPFSSWYRVRCTHMYCLFFSANFSSQMQISDQGKSLAFAAKLVCSSRVSIRSSGSADLKRTKRARESVIL